MHPSLKYTVTLLVFLLSFSACQPNDKTGMVDGAKARELVQSGALLLDVRTPGEFQRGHIDGAVNIPLSLLDSNMSQLDKSKPVVVYCQSGSRSRQARSLLSSAGYTVYDLGGIFNW